MKHPLLLVALAYAAGVVLADLARFPLPVFPLLLSAAALALLGIAWPKRRLILLWTLLPLAGAANLAFRSAALAPDDVRVLLGNHAAIAWVRGELAETPYYRLYDHGEDETWRTLAQLQVSAIRFQGGEWQTAFGRMIVSTPGLVPEGFYGGTEVEIDGTLRRPRAAVAEGLFDYGSFLQRHGIYYQLVATSTNDWRLAGDATSGGMPPLADRFSAWAKAMLARGLPAEDEPLHLLWAMTLGWKTALTGEVSEPFMRSGTMHVFAISGLHIALITGILVAGLRVMRVPRFVCGLVVIPFIWIYTGFTGWQPSAIRSTIMMSVIIAGWSLRRPSDLLNSLAAAAFILLLIDPRQLFHAGFQLSFSVVLSLALFMPVLDAIRAKLLRYDPLVPDELRPRWQRLARLPLDYVSASLTTSLAAWLGSIPLVAYYFHLFTPVSLLANVIVVPLSSAALACTMGSLFVGAWIPVAAELFNHSAWFFMWLMVRVSQWCAQLPGGWFSLASPSALGFALYYAALVSAMAGWLARPRLRGWVAGGLAALALAFGIQIWKNTSATRLSLLPLNGGEAIYFKPAGRAHDLLIDCGDTSSFEFITKQYLRGQGVNRLGGLLLTHGDIRNVGAATTAYAMFSPRSLWLNAVSFRSAAYRQIRAEFEKIPGLSRTLTNGGQAGSWKVLHPAAQDSFSQADDNALVLLGEIDGFRVLLLSDLGKPGQNALLERHPDLRADIVVSGLPVQSEPVADALLDTLDPRLLIITDAEHPATARAPRKLQERLEARSIPVMFTRETGGITLSFRGADCVVRTVSGEMIPLQLDDGVHPKRPIPTQEGEPP